MQTLQRMLKANASALSTKVWCTVRISMTQKANYNDSSTVWWEPKVPMARRSGQCGVSVARQKITVSPDTTTS